MLKEAQKHGEFPEACNSSSPPDVYRVMFITARSYHSSHSGIYNTKESTGAKFSIIKGVPTFEGPLSFVVLV